MLNAVQVGKICYQFVNIEKLTRTSGTLVASAKKKHKTMNASKKLDGVGPVDNRPSTY